MRIGGQNDIGKSFIRNSVNGIPCGSGVSCAVVGNAQSILSTKYGNIIDAHDVVVRINNPVIKKSESQGTRCDLIFVTHVTVIKLPKIPPEQCEYEVVNVSTHLKDYFETWAATLRKEVRDSKARPTTGFIATMKMLELGYSVRLFGFDWFATPTIHMPTDDTSRDKEMWKHHHPGWERQKISDMLVNYGITK